MPEKRVCSFCGNDIEPGTGWLYVKRDGTHHHFCSSKCRRNLLDLKRSPRLVKWTTIRRKGVAVLEAAAPAAKVKIAAEPAGKKPTVVKE